MGKMIGGPLDGRPADKTMITLQRRYNQVALQNNCRIPAAVYERVKQTDDFKWVATFEDEEELRVWLSAHPDEWSYH
jgi:hypothetical protein